jgi:sugar phosphate isomerase/epimerase
MTKQRRNQEILKTSVLSIAVMLPDDIIDLILPWRWDMVTSMQPTIALCNIFDQDAERLAKFAAANGFTGIDWSMDPSLPERDFLSLMKSLRGLQVRYHCRFHGVDLAYTDHRGDDSLALLMCTVDQVARAGGRHMTVHSGLGNRFGEGIEATRLIENLSILMEHGRSNDVAIALENLTTPLTDDPLQFRRIVAESGAYVTIDIGHAHAISGCSQRDDIFGDYVLPLRDRILNAHIYHTELDGFGHVPPCTLSDICNRLDLLVLAPCCDWWVIELMNPSEVLRTRDILQTHLDSLTFRPDVTATTNPLPLVAV